MTEFHYSRKERLEQASPAVRQAAERKGSGRRGVFSRNPSLRLTLWDLAIILVVAVVLIPLVRWLGARGISEDYHMVLNGMVYEEEVLAGITVLAEGESPEGEEPVEVRFFLDGEPVGKTLRDLAPREKGERRTLRTRLPYNGEEKLAAEVVLGGEENRLRCDLEPEELSAQE